MAILTAEQLAISRRESCRGDPTLQNATKPVINAALQAIEDWFEANRASLNTAMNVATAPVVLAAAQKRTLAAYWLKSKFDRGG